MLKKDLHEANRLSWNAATRAHNSHKGDQARFLREGGSTLFPEERELLGELRGRSLLHLQCNAGQDSLSLSALGAQVTGVDISDEAIDFARRLSADSGLPASFERSDVFDWLASAPAARFDFVFCSYGVLFWLSDLNPWAEGISRVLKPGGRFVLVEFHPTLWLFDEKLRLAYPYRGGHHLAEAKGVGDYVAQSGTGLVPSGYQQGVRDFQNPHPCHGFQWGLGDVINPLVRHGLALERLEEYCYANGCKVLEGMREAPGHRYLPPRGRSRPAAHVRALGAQGRVSPLPARGDRLPATGSPVLSGLPGHSPALHVLARLPPSSSRRSPVAVPIRWVLSGAGFCSHGAVESGG